MADLVAMAAAGEIDPQPFAAQHQPPPHYHFAFPRKSFTVPPYLPFIEQP
jgi:hypothetical protein